MKQWGLWVVVALAVTGCDKLADSSRAVQSVTKHAFADTTSSWRDFFTYHPPVEPPLPQTRYCYQAQSDIVCYDSEQSQLTSKLVGYQHGDAVAWVQPGGGSTGASGGAPEALRPPTVQARVSQAVPNYQAQGYDVNTDPLKPAADIRVNNLPSQVIKKTGN